MTDEVEAKGEYTEMKLSDLRTRVGLTQAEVADRMFVSKAQVSRIEGHYPYVMLHSLRAYLDALDVEIRFSQEGFEDCLSGDVVADETRNDALRTRRLDQSRGRFRRTGPDE
ncbi:helix-turn-helix transcriptional regulator [Streptomyces sp. VNUA74]|uniref:helix-turn-helix domain-containing protein n=1 Tax=Streptomyces sp. VNUA74 TaxID=3062685 RepID=UPI00280B3EC7|nr:helix-turn-helix transcriptional regulator [Streptomyces sp. VNUA74]WML79192.1 helix-turn-helix transcriptional regulator [Streptomyces sp. VNUA74]